MAKAQDNNSELSKMKGAFPNQYSPVVRFASPDFVETGTEPTETGGPRKSALKAISAFNRTPKSGIIAGLEDTSQIFMNQSMASISFTPIMTPNRGGDIVLLSPSKTISETLKALATVTGHQLEEIWDEVGYSPEDRASQLSDLIVKIRDLFEAKIAEEKGVLETFRQTIAEAKQEIEQLSAALHQPYCPEDPSADGSGQHVTLMDELGSLETKLEELRSTALQARDELKDCLDFLVEGYEALGIDIDPQWRDIDSNLTAQRREQFHQKRAELKAELSSRSATVVQLVRDCQSLMRDLSFETEDNCSDLDKRIAGSLVRSKDDSFMMTSKHRTDTCVGISGTAVNELTKRISELQAEKKRRKAKLQDMGQEIAKLWEKLRVPEAEQMAFTESVRGLGLDTLNKGEAELNRLNMIKAEMIVQLVLEARQEIQQLWDQIDADEDYRRAFPAFHVGSEQRFDDQLLEAHEAYLGELHARLEARQPILRLIERREAIVKERMEYEKMQQDSERLKQRSGALARQLLEEEKMARRIKRDLPKLTSLLIEKLIEWKEQQGEHFIFQGSVYLDQISRQDEEWEAYKEQKHQKMLNKKQEENASGTASGFGVKNKTNRQPRQPLGDAKVNSKVNFGSNNL